jgi:hypothetical protein
MAKLHIERGKEQKIWSWEIDAGRASMDLTEGYEWKSLQKRIEHFLPLQVLSLHASTPTSKS